MLALPVQRLPLLSEGELLMSRVLITGSAEGLGPMAARLLADDGHSVTLHAHAARLFSVRREAKQGVGVSLGGRGIP